MTPSSAEAARLDAIIDEAIERALDLKAAARDTAAEFVKALAILEVEWGLYESYESARQGEQSRIIAKALAANGYDPTDADLMARFKAMVESYVEQADRYDNERRNRQMLTVWGSGPPGDRKVLDDPEARKVWLHVYRPRTCSGERMRPPANVQAHGARHRRTPARRPTHRRGSRRGGSRGDPDSEPDSDEAPRARSRRVAATREQLLTPAASPPPDPKGGRPMSAAPDYPVHADQAEIELPLDPVQLARLTAPERGAVYRRLDLDRLQIDAAETAARSAIARRLRDESQGVTR